MNHIVIIWLVDEIFITTYGHILFAYTQKSRSYIGQNNSWARLCKSSHEILTLAHELLSRWNDLHVANHAHEFVSRGIELISNGDDLKYFAFVTLFGLDITDSFQGRQFTRADRSKRPTHSASVCALSPRR